MESSSPRCGALCTRLGAYDPLVEIGVGRRPQVAAALAARGIDVTATDLRSRDVPDGVAFVRDDAFDPDLTVYADAAAIYALNLPPELHGPVRAIARAVEVPFLFTTLGADAPAIPVAMETIPGDTLFRAVGQRRRVEDDRPEARSRGRPAGTGDRRPTVGDRSPPRGDGR